MRISLGVLLAFALAGLQLLAVLMVVFSSYLTSERALLKHARDLLRDVGTNTIEHSKGFLNPAQGAAELAARLAQNRVVASDDPVLLEQLLFQQLQITPQFAGVYYGSEDGSFVMVMRDPEGPAPFRSKIITTEQNSRNIELIWRDDQFQEVERVSDPTDPYDPRTRTWYNRAKSDLTTIWTDPYIFFSSQQPGITLASPVRGGPSGVRGVVGVDIEISRISDFLSRLKIGNTGKAMIIHRNGDVIAHPDLSLIKTGAEDGTLRFANISEFQDPIARTAFGPLLHDGRMLVAEDIPSEFKYEGERYVSMVMPIISDMLPWTIAVYAPENDFTGVIKRNRTMNLWIAVLVAVVTGLVGLVLAEFINRPVRAFAVRSALIAQGEIDPALPQPKTYKELERANQTLVQEINARRDTENEYGQTFEMSSRAMAQITPSGGQIIRANARFGEIVGLAPVALVGRKLVELAHPDDGPRFRREGVDGSGEDSISNLTMRWHRGDGSLIWVRLNAIMIRDQKGAPIHAVLTVDDITDIRAKEGQIAQLNRDLSHLARGNTMGQMAAGLAHELNQPLTAIAQNADSALLTLERARQDYPELRDILTEIEHQSLRAGEIIRALRGFIRKDEGEQVRFDFAALLEQTLSLVHAEASESGVALRTELGPLPPVQGNRVQIAQVVVNLLRNAIESIATGTGNPRLVRVTAGHEEGEGTAGRILVRVIDSGPGVDPAINLFTQFETTKPDGMGLGLSICRSIIEANGGALWYEPAEPNGATFSFTLPASKDA